MAVSKRYPIWIIGIAVIASLGFIQNNSKKAAPEPKKLPTLTTPISQNRISIKELDYWDKVAWDLVKQYPIEAPSRVFAYLYHAQKAFADMSFAITGTYSGNLGPISIYVLKIFFPKYQPSEEDLSDPFSQELAVKVGKQVEDLCDKEQAHIRAVIMPKGKNLWTHTEPFGLKIPSMQPWALSKASEFRPTSPPPPEDQFWQNQAKITKELSDKATEEQKRLVLLWDGSLDPREADWKNHADLYMEEKKSSLEMRLEVREKLSKAMVDAFIAVYEAKYVFMVKRPDMIDPSIKTVIPTPKHPSFPSAHSTVSMAAATVLSYYFPENQKQWLSLADESGMSRIWGGIHFPYDHEVGQQLGSKVGLAVLFR